MPARRASSPNRSSIAAAISSISASTKWVPATSGSQPSDGSLITTHPLAIASTARAHSKYGDVASDAAATAVDVEQQLRRRQQSVLVGAEHCLGCRRVDRAIAADQSDVGVQPPEMRRKFGERRAAAIVEATHEQHVDRPIRGRRDRRRIEGTPPRRRRSTATPSRRSASTPWSLMSSVNSPRRHASAASRNHEVPGCSVLMQMLAAAARCSSVASGREQFEELVWRDDQIDRTVGAWQAVVDHLDLSAGQLSGLGNPTGDLRHELVAALGDENLYRSHALLTRRDLPVPGASTEHLADDGLGG